LTDFAIAPPCEASRRSARERLDSLTKPLGALGVLESVAERLCGIQRTAKPSIDNPTLLVFAADHGIASEGVSAYPKAVTQQMVANFVAGGAAVNALARQFDCRLQFFDVGIDGDVSNTANLTTIKIARGTNNVLFGNAMSAEDCRAAILSGADAARAAAKSGANVLALGEMGIGNTTISALLMHRLTGVAIADCVGRGTGVDAAGLAHKIDAVRRAAARAQSLNRHDSSALTPEALLQESGGFEIAALAGAVLAGAESRCAILIDGFTVTIAAALAARANPRVLDYCFFAHLSAEQAHGRLLAWLGVRPLLDLGMRLGEGSGALTALPLLRAAVACFNEMATFASARVSGREERRDIA
jgi:nicotinate-nucleotide--dimethylbenzimidazole phosphoribosyltransferase